MKTISNEEKAKQIAENLYKKWGDSAYATGAEYGAIEMAKWKDEQFAKDKQQWIEEACNTIQNLLGGYIIRNFISGDSYRMNKIIDDFKQAMKGE